MNFQHAKDLFQVWEFLRFRWNEFDFGMVFLAFSVLFQKLELGRKGLQKTLQDGMELDSEINSASFFHHLVSSKKQEEAC